MFRNVPACSGMFHVPGFIDGRCESATTNFKKNLRDQGSASEKVRENNVRSFPLSVSTARKITVPLTITMVLENFKDETCLLHDLER